jgi:hypothetical protein
LRALRSLKYLHNSKLPDSARDVIHNCMLHLPCEFARVIGLSGDTIHINLLHFLQLVVIMNLWHV